MRLARCSSCAAPLARVDDDLCGNCVAQRLALWVLSALAAVVALAIALIAHAQEAAPAPVVLTPQLALARVCAKEEGLMPGRGQSVEQHDASLRDGCTAIDQVLSRRARLAHAEFGTFACRYSANACTPGGMNPWVADLSWGDRMPNGWPLERVLWMPLRRRDHLNGLTEWRKLMHLSAAIMRGEIESACPVEPDHWGSPLLDHERREREGWVSEHCGAALNEFWVVPARHRAAGAR
jgi:hypothetical protein